MGYKNFLDNKAMLAFNLLKDLADVATFSNTSVSGFDFDSGTVEKSTAAPVTIKMVVIETKKADNTITKTVLCRLTDTSILDEFDTLTFQGQTWNIGDKLSENGRVLMFSIVREGS